MFLPAAALAFWTAAGGLWPTGTGPAPLSYVESGEGLDEPGFDGGDTEFEMGDVDGDGHVDLVSVGDHGNPLINSDEEGILVWLGNGHGSWTHRHFGHLGYGGLGLGDVDGDGVMDVAYGIHHDYGTNDLGDQLLEVALGDGTGSYWEPWDDGLAEHGQDWGMFATDLGDVDGDGDLDVGSMGFGSSDGLHVYLNRADGSWKRGFGYLGGNSNHVFEFGDVDGDGRLDIATSKAEGSVWIGDGEGFFTEADGNLPPPSAGWVHSGVSLGDVDGDGLDDLAFCDEAENPRVFLSRGVASWTDVSSGIQPTGTCEHTELHDMNGDGLVDLATFGEGEVAIFAGDGTGQTWAPLAQFATGDDPGQSRSFRVGGDVDHNGLPDMVLVNTQQVDLFNYVNVVRAYRESSVPASLSVRVVQPGPARRLLAGSVTFVDWATAIPPLHGVASVAVDLSTTGPAGPWIPVASALPDNGRFQWIVPPLFSEECYLRVTASALADAAVATSAAPFTIARRPDPIAISFAGRDTLGWSDALARDRYNLYRSDWQTFLDTGEYTQDPAATPQADRACDLLGTVQADPFEPAPGTLVFYLVTAYRLAEDGQTPGVPVPMAEGTLGQDSSAAMREGAHPCPEP